VGYAHPASSMLWDADSNRVSFSTSTAGTWQFAYDVTARISRPGRILPPLGRTLP